MHSFKSFRRTECEAGITLSNKPYEAVDINEMALDVYNATIDQSKRRSCEKEYGSGLKSSWYKLNELCMDLKPYFRMKQSNRKGIVTTLGKIYGSNLPMNVDFFQNIDASINDETASMRGGGDFGLHRLRQGLAVLSCALKSLVASPSAMTT